MSETEIGETDVDIWPKVRKKRYIAGAVCPQCRAHDRLLVEWVEAYAGAAMERRRRCVACGFGEAEPAQAERPLSALPRIRLGAQPQDVAATPVKLLAPEALMKSKN